MTNHGLSSRSAEWFCRALAWLPRQVWMGTLPCPHSSLSTQAGEQRRVSAHLVSFRLRAYGWVLSQACVTTRKPLGSLSTQTLLPCGQGTCHTTNSSSAATLPFPTMNSVFCSLMPYLICLHLEYSWKCHIMRKALCVARSRVLSPQRNSSPGRSHMDANEI